MMGGKGREFSTGQASEAADTEGIRGTLKTLPGRAQNRSRQRLPAAAHARHRCPTASATLRNATASAWPAVDREIQHRKIADPAVMPQRGRTARIVSAYGEIWVRSCDRRSRPAVRLIRGLLRIDLSRSHAGPAPQGRERQERRELHRHPLRSMSRAKATMPLRTIDSRVRRPPPHPAFLASRPEL
jgi:hypothetical protein